MRTCYTCKIETPEEEFYSRQRSCKPCVRVRTKAYAAANAAWRKEYDRIYAQTHRGPIAERTRSYYQRNKAKVKARVDAYRRANPEKISARQAVAKAILRGKLSRKPCSRCGSSDAEAHHESYASDRQLDVTWLCHLHHAQRHVEIIKMEGDCFDLQS